MNLYQELLSLLRVYRQERVPYALCGGIAVAVHGYPRFTQDIDLLIRPEDLQWVSQITRDCGFILESGRIPLGAGEPFPRDLYRMSKVVDNELVTVDLMLVNPLLQPAWDSKREFLIHDEPVFVVSRSGLAIMKRLAGRGKDLIDLEELGLSDEGLDT